MNEQVIILLFLVFGLTVTLFLYIWKAKKEIDYRKDERWLLIQTKAITTTNYLSSALIVFVAIAEIISIFYDINITLTLNRVLTYIICFIGIRNSVELFSLIHFDNQL